LHVRAAATFALLSRPRCLHVRAAFTSALPPRSSPSSPLTAGRRNGRGGSGAFCLLDLRDQAGGLGVGHDGPRRWRRPAGPVLVFTPEEWRKFTAGVHGGELDLSRSRSAAYRSC
jgi:hypothetical protein